MSDLYREPIEESDLALKEKFVGGNISAAKVKPAERRERSERREGVAERDSAYDKILQKVKNQGDNDADKHAHTVADDARVGAAHPDAESQIKHLIDLAMTKNVVHAVKVAQHMEDYHVLDTFHDRMLAEELHDALVEKGLI